MDQENPETEAPRRKVVGHTHRLRRAFAHAGRWYSRRNEHEIAELPEAVRDRHVESGAIAIVPVYERPPAIPAWPHKITPAQYLRRHPDGPSADLARKLTGSDAADAGNDDPDTEGDR